MDLCFLQHVRKVVVSPRCQLPRIKNLVNVEAFRFQTLLPILKELKSHIFIESLDHLGESTKT